METKEFSESSEKINVGISFITIAELVKRTTLSRATINRYIKNGTIPVVRLGRRVIVDSEFLNCIKGQRAVFPAKGDGDEK